MSPVYEYTTCPRMLLTGPKNASHGAHECFSQIQEKIFPPPRLFPFFVIYRPVTSSYTLS